MGKQEYKWSDKVRFGELPKVERKVITKLSSGGAGAGFDHTPICSGEIGAMLKCFQTNAWRTGDCESEIKVMQTCVEEHKGDPDPRVLARRWQSSLRQNVFQWFARQKVAGRLR